MRLLEKNGGITAGHVWFHDQDLVALTDQEMQEVRGNDISMIFQEPMTALNPVYTCGDQIAEAVQLHGKVDAKAARNRAIEVLRLVGISDPERRAKQYPHELSGGMRQRVMIAMALSCNPRVLIADEPTTALDVTIQAQILDLLHDLQRQFKMSVLLITHDLGVVSEMCQPVAVMYAGQIVEQADVRRLFRSPQMPYTEALLSSIPKFGMTQAQKLATIRGMVPSPLSWPSSCRFAPRCDYRFDRCDAPPPLFDVGEQRCACWLCESGRRETAPTLPSPASGGGN